jgi:methylated-DNA-[protein]-cysteine S-methyltransferase
MNVSILNSKIEIDESVIADPPEEIRSQVREYEGGERYAFDLDVDFPDGVTGEVMAAMAAIPYGETRSYGAIAAELDTAPVAVGQACGRNPVPLVVPCHRVVGANGELRGYSAADGITTKRRLLELEARERKTDSGQTRLPTE